MKAAVLLLGGWVFAVALLRADDVPRYLDKTVSTQDRANDLLSHLTQDEKLSLLGGADVCTAAAIPRLQIPPMRMADAGAGVRGIDGSNNGFATLFTCGVMMASTWDPVLIHRVGAAIGEEAHNKKVGSQILLGPAVNIQRSPLGGRNGEYFSEDPHLAARMAVGYIQGMQSEGTAACIKHFACNNEEVDRGDVNVQVSERALREIYFPAFEAGVREGHVWTVMSSYNRVNGPHSSANHYLLTDVLKKGWGFDGMVMSDWGGVHQVALPINAGNDLEMPGPPKMVLPDKVKLALQNDQTTQAPIDEAVRRILLTIVRTGLLDGVWKTNPALVNSAVHDKLARDVAEQGIVLLKNKGNILPLDPAKIHSITLVGPGARVLQMGAMGSPFVEPLHSVGPEEGIRNRAGEGIAVDCVEESGNAFATIPAASLAPPGNSGGHGLLGEYFNNRDLRGTPLHTRTDATVNFNMPDKPDVGFNDIGPDNFSVRWTGTVIAPATGRFIFGFTADDGCRLYIDGKKIIDHWVLSPPDMQTAEIDLERGKTYSIRVEFFQGGAGAVAQLGWRIPQEAQRIAEIEAAKKADAAIVFVSTYKTEEEGHDRPSMSLPNDQDGLVRAIAAVNKHTIVVLNNGTPVDMRAWIDQVSGLIEAWFPGQEGGSAIASILFGDVNPSGKLPTTLGARREDYPDYGNFPGVKHRVSYEEGIYVGYRHFDKENIAPLFPFGFGLSYTTFEYGPLQLSSTTLAPDGKLSVNMPVKNTGSRAGSEVVELYVHDPAPKIDKPVRELKGFAKINLVPGETKTVMLQITPRDLAYFDVPGRQWKADAGDYEIGIGASSRDIRQKTTIHLGADFTEAVPLSRDQLALNGGFGKSAAHDLAAERPVQASSVAGPFTPERAVDNDDTTGWTSQPGDAQWLIVDLGQSTLIDRARLFWADDYALGYSLQVSGDGQAWTNVATTDKGMGDIEWIHFTPVQARWVRVLATRPSIDGHRYTIDSFEVYAPGEEATAR